MKRTQRTQRQQWRNDWINMLITGIGIGFILTMCLLTLWPGLLLR